MKIDVEQIETTGGELADRLGDIDPSDRQRLARLGVDPASVRRAGVIRALAEFFERADTARLPTLGAPIAGFNRDSTKRRRRSQGR